MGRKIWVLAIILLLLMGQARAADVTLPEELRRAAPEVAELMGDGEKKFDLTNGVKQIWLRGKKEVERHLSSGIRSVISLMMAGVFLGTAESLSPRGEDFFCRCITMVGALWITAVSAGDVDALMGLGRETIGEISAFSKLLLPSLAAATAAGGGVTAASVRQVAAVFVSDILLTVIDALLMPMVHLYIGVAAASAVLEEEGLERAGKLLKRVIVWSLSGILILFTTYLTISGAVASAVDERAVRLAKAAVSGAVPVVGGILSGVAESVLAGAGILRGMIGTFGALAVVSICLVPVLRLGVQYLLYQGAGLVVAIAGPKKLTRLIVRLSDAFALVLAMTVASAMVLVISVVSSLTAVMP